MIFDPEHVKKALRQKVLWGYDPEWDLESVEDHDTDWMAIPKQEFYRIKKAAQLEKKQQARAVSACQTCTLR